MSTVYGTNRAYCETLYEVAARLDDAQRAENYLRALVDGWDEYNDEERREEVRTALDRLTRFPKP